MSRKTELARRRHRRRYFSLGTHAVVILLLFTNLSLGDGGASIHPLPPLIFFFSAVRAVEDGVLEAVEHGRLALLVGGNGRSGMVGEISTFRGHVLYCNDEAGYHGAQ